MVRARGIDDRVILKSFDRDILDRFAALAPEIPRLYVYLFRLPWLGLAVDAGLTTADALDQDVTWLQAHRMLLSARFVARAQSEGFKVIAWDVHEETRMRKMIDRGVDGIETDHPDVLLRLLGRAH